MFDFALGEHTTQQLRDFHRSGTHQYRTADFHQTLDFVNDGFVFFAFGLVQTVVHVDTGDGTVGRNHHHIQFVDVPKFAGFGFCCTGHTRQLVVHTEIILQGDGGEGLGGRFHFHSFLGFDSLMQTIRVTTTFHDTAGLFVHNLHLVVNHYIFVVAIEEAVSLQQLGDGVDTFRFDGVVVDEFVFLGNLFFVAQHFVFQFRKLRSDVGQYEELRIFRVAGEAVDTFVGQFDGVVLFVDNEIQRIGHHVHFLVVVLHVEFFGFLHAGLHALFAEELDQRLVFGHGLVGTIQEQRTFFVHFGIFAGHFLFGFGQQFGGHIALDVYQTFHLRTQFFEQLIFALGHRTGNNQRCTGIVNQHGVNLVDNGVVVFALYQIERAAGHVVAQIVETEFVVGTESNIGQISLTTFFRIGTMFVDAIYRQAVEHIERTHPFRVTFRQVVVDSNHVYTAAGKCIQENGQGGHQSFTFTGSHFRNLTLMQYHTTEQLYIVVHHVPFHFVTTGNPMILIQSLVTFDADKVVLGGQFAVERRGRYFHNFVFGETTCGIFHDGKYLRQYYHQFFFNLFGNLLVDFVDFGIDFFSVNQVERFDTGFQFVDFGLFLAGALLHLLAQLLGQIAQFIVAQGFNGRISRLDFLNIRIDFFKVSL